MLEACKLESEIARPAFSDGCPAFTSAVRAGGRDRRVLLQEAKSHESGKGEDILELEWTGPGTDWLEEEASNRMWQGRVCFRADGLLPGYGMSGQSPGLGLTGSFPGTGHVGRDLALAAV